MICIHKQTGGRDSHWDICKLCGIIWLKASFVHLTAAGLFGESINCAKQSIIWPKGILCSFYSRGPLRPTAANLTEGHVRANLAEGPILFYLMISRP